MFETKYFLAEGTRVVSGLVMSCRQMLLQSVTMWKYLEIDKQASKTFDPESARQNFFGCLQTFADKMTILSKWTYDDC